MRPDSVAREVAISDLDLAYRKYQQWMGNAERFGGYNEVPMPVVARILVMMTVPV
jgi:hypothetical protein